MQNAALIQTPASCTYVTGILAFTLTNSSAGTFVCFFNQVTGGSTNVDSFSFGSGAIDAAAAKMAFDLACLQSESARIDCHDMAEWDEGPISHGMHPLISLV